MCHRTPGSHCLLYLAIEAHSGCLQEQECQLSHSGNCALHQYRNAMHTGTPRSRVPVR